MLLQELHEVNETHSKRLWSPTVSQFSYQRSSYITQKSAQQKAKDLSPVPTYCVFIHILLLSLELAPLRQGGNNQSETEVMQLSFVAVTPLLAAALTLWFFVAFQIKCSGIWQRQTANKASDSTVAALMTLTHLQLPCPSLKSLCQLLLVLRLILFVPSCAPGKPSQGSWIRIHEKYWRYKYVWHAEQDKHFSCLSGQCLLIKI